MTMSRKPQNYRHVIDELVRMCHHGQGQIGARHVGDGVWNRNASDSFIPEQHRINLLLERLSTAEREALASMLKQAVITGVFETLKVLEEFQIEPFTAGYEGSPYHDFIGRLNDRNWPED
jgi:hypothetical protein